MTDINELQRFTGTGHNVFISYIGFVNEWECKFEARSEGLKLEASGRGDTPEAAFHEAAAKFDRVTNSGAKELNPALTYEPQRHPNDIEAAPSPENDDPAPLDDEVPY